MRLRDLTTDDLDLYEALNAPEMMEHLGGPDTSIDMADKVVRDAEAMAADRYWVLVIEPDDAPGVAAGTITIWDHDAHGEPITEMGWMVLPAFQGRGIGSAAARAALDRVRATGRWEVVHAFPPVANERSNGMCRTLGFRFVEERTYEFRGRPIRCNHWRLDLRG